MASGWYLPGYMPPDRTPWRGGYPPRTLTPPSNGLALWLKADAGVTQAGGTVSAWLDQSGNGKNVSQATGGLQPAFTASSINGLPGITWNGTASMGFTGAGNSPLASNSARTVVTVTKGNNSTKNGTVIQFGGAGEHMQLCEGLTVLANILYGGRTSNWTTTTPLTASGHIFEYYTTGVIGAPGALSVNMDGVALTLNGSAVEADDATGGWSVGSRPAQGGQSYNGDICEILVWDHVLTTGELTQARAYLKGRFGMLP